MTLTAARKKANDKYISNNYTRIALSMPNAEAEALREHCAKHGHTVAGFIRAAIKAAIAAEEAKDKPAMLVKVYTSCGEYTAEYREEES